MPSRQPAREAQSIYPCPPPVSGSKGRRKYLFGSCGGVWPLEERFPTPGLPLRSAISLDLSDRCCWPRFVHRSPFQHSRTCSSEDNGAAEKSLPSLEPET